MNRKLLGKRIKEERIRIGLTQEQLAEYINVSTTYVGFIERGERSVTLEKLILLAECFRIPIDSLLHDVDDSTLPDKEQKLNYLWQHATSKEQDMILSIIDVIIQANHNQ